MQQNTKRFLVVLLHLIILSLALGTVLLIVFEVFIRKHFFSSNYIEVLLFFMSLIVVILHGRIRNNKSYTALYKELIVSQDKLKNQLIELKSNENQVKRSEERYNFVISTLKIGIWDYDATTNVTYIAPQLHNMFGFSAKEFENYTKRWHRRVHPEDRLKVMRLFRERLKDHAENIDCQLRHITKQGEYRWVQAIARVHWDTDGKLLRLAGSLTDITDKKEDEEKIKHMAYYDSLTGLPNRAYLQEYVTTMIKRGKMAALIFIDIDNFKYVNDSFGHNLGDSVIIEISKRISGLVVNGIVARWGGDEIIVIMENIKSDEEVCQFAGEMIDKVFLSFSNKGVIVNLSISAGVAIYPEHGRNFETLLKNADTAMYSAKYSGKNKYSIFDIKMNEVLYQKMKYEGYLREAIEKNELQLYFQPQYNMKEGTLLGVEALMRWHNEALGDVSPNEFIPVAETSGLIIPLGIWVFKQACGFQLKLSSLGYENIMVAINISVMQFIQEDFVDFVKTYIIENKVNPQMLEFEITESILVDSTEMTISKLKELRKTGIKIALDDFGTGYSSLTYLKCLPIDTLKMDKSFIENVTVDKVDQDISGLIINVAHSLGLNVVAEGVETIEQRDVLMNFGCDIAQGYLYSEAVKDTVLLEMLSEKRE